MFDRIEINPAPNWRICNICQSGDDVYEITLHYNKHQGTQIALCRNCIKELREVTRFAGPGKEADNE